METLKEVAERKRKEFYEKNKGKGIEGVVEYIYEISLFVEVPAILIKDGTIIEDEDKFWKIKGRKPICKSFFANKDCK